MVGWKQNLELLIFFVLTIIIILLVLHDVSDCELPKLIVQLPYDLMYDMSVMTPTSLHVTIY